MNDFEVNNIVSIKHSEVNTIVSIKNLEANNIVSRLIDTVIDLGNYSIFWLK